MVPVMWTVSKIIQELGGSGEIAAKLGFQYQSRVANWPRIGIPRAQWPEILDLAKGKGLKLTFDDLRRAEKTLLHPDAPDEGLPAADPRVAV
jgi:hypothetical protein